MSGSDLPETCAQCGEQLPLSDWHPIKATTARDGSFSIYGFCDEDCLARWE